MIGTRLGHYEITSHLGSGGMGEVYQAADVKLGRRTSRSGPIGPARSRFTSAT